jgi:hypothetical protein
VGVKERDNPMPAQPQCQTWIPGNDAVMQPNFMKLTTRILTLLLLTTVATAQEQKRTSPPSTTELAEGGRPFPEYVGTPQYIYRIETDGSITYLMTMEEYRKKKNN